MGLPTMGLNALNLIGCITHEFGTENNWNFVRVDPNGLHEHVRPMADNIKGDRIGLPIYRGDGWNHVDSVFPPDDG